jgi:hypothetical protein
MINLSKTPIKDNTTINPNEPQPVAIQGDGKKLWIVKSIVDDAEYKIWAETYQQALELLPLIESF